jgi:hypothetical protein
MIMLSDKKKMENELLDLHKNADNALYFFSIMNYEFICKSIKFCIPRLRQSIECRHIMHDARHGR